MVGEAEDENEEAAANRDTKEDDEEVDVLQDREKEAVTPDGQEGHKERYTSTGASSEVE